MNTAIKSKERNYELWNLGRFGNTLRTWDDPCKAIIDDSFFGPYVVRSKKPSGPCFYHIPNKGALRDTMVPIWMKADLDLNKSFYVNEVMPVEHVTVQGELQRTEQGLYFFYSHQKLHMREALKTTPRHATGFYVNCLLKTYCQQYAEVLLSLLDEYPDHIVEFTAFDCPVGNLGWPIIVWECRCY